MRVITLSILLLLAATFGGCAETNFNTVKNKPMPQNKNSVEISSEVMIAVNRLRAERKLKPLVVDSELDKLARHYSQQMAKSGHFDHKDPSGQKLEDRLSIAGINDWVLAGENLAKTINATDPGAEAVRGWQLSPGHSENLFNADYQFAGTGVYITGKNECYITQVYMKKSN